MSVRYHCTHTADPRPPYPPQYPSSSFSFASLDSLYFCEECDAIRCDDCVAVEVASYYCPNCLFDVPSANVRGDRNRCARSCFACPQCTAALQVIATETVDPSSSQTVQGPPFLLTCPICKWSSKEIGWTFEKGTGIALQLQRMDKESEAVQSEFEAIKDNLEAYMAASTRSAPSLKLSTTRQPTRHISQLTQMAAKALGRDVPGMAKVNIRQVGGIGLGETGNTHWDDIGAYKAKGTWKEKGLEVGFDDVKTLQSMGHLEFAPLGRRWAHSWEINTMARSTLPERISLQSKLTKRCPDASCRHLLIQPDTKSTRFRIKMVASNYLPEVEIGRRRRLLVSNDLDQPMTQEEIDRRRRERRRTRAKGDEEDEEMGQNLMSGHLYTFQMAFTNPLYDPIQIRLTQPPPPRNAPATNHHVHLLTQHFTVSALKEAWAYDEEGEDDDGSTGMEGSEGVSEGGNSARGAFGRRSRKSLLSGGVRDKKRGEPGVEKKGNVSKVGVEVEVLPGAVGPVDFDLEVRYTYRADAEDEKQEREPGGKEEYKTFTYWIRVHVGDVE